MDNKIGLADALKMIAMQLNEIMVPAKYTQEIANPIAMSVRNLEACIEAITTGQDEPEADADGAEEN